MSNTETANPTAKAVARHVRVTPMKRVVLWTWSAGVRLKTP